MDKFKLAQIVNSIALLIGLAGVVIIFLWGPPQPSFEAAGLMSVELGTEVEPGKTAAQKDAEIAVERHHYKVMANLGLGLVGLSFALQFVALWLPTQAKTTSSKTGSQPPLQQTPQ